MKRRWPLAVVAVAVIGGLVALGLAWRPWAGPRSFETADELGYLIEYEFDPDTMHAHQSNPDREGQEYVGVLVQGHYSMQIIDGQVTVKQTPRGAVRKGDRLRITLDGRLWVNGAERRP
jgi:hypothetical protein